ncbi:sterile alpha motif domain-containing protein 1-like isoform X2 [Gallus gallus]|uniref:sterile alpha motif domain-containing protein 1-like isoform X2 n=1 Tax=Gallus gallus TaxID=9031 RepID=UPI001EFFB507|nr:sterile alpha motif domain-containing protein 1-like isoform X2 [Gallus gallus]
MDTSPTPQPNTAKRSGTRRRAGDKKGSRCVWRNARRPRTNVTARPQQGLLSLPAPDERLSAKRTARLKPRSGPSARAPGRARSRPPFVLLAVAEPTRRDHAEKPPHLKWRPSASRARDPPRPATAVPAPRTWAGGQGGKAAGRTPPRLPPGPQRRAERSSSPRAQPFIAPPLPTSSPRFAGPRFPLPADPGPARLASHHSPPLPPCRNCAMGANKGAAALYIADVTAGRGPGCKRRRAQQGETAACRALTAAASCPAWRRAGRELRCCRELSGVRRAPLRLCLGSVDGIALKAQFTALSR